MWDVLKMVRSKGERRWELLKLVDPLLVGKAGAKGNRLCSHSYLAVNFKWGHGEPHKVVGGHESPPCPTKGPPKKQETGGVSFGFHLKPPYQVKSKNGGVPLVSL